MSRRPREDESSASRGLLFPIGLGLGALVAIALFLAVRSGPTLDDTETEGLAVDTIDRDDAPPAGAEAETLVAIDATAAPMDEPTVLDPTVDPAVDPPVDPADALADPAGGSAIGDTDGLPGATDPETSDLFGGRIVMVSSGVPRVIVLADGTSLAPGETLPSGHRIVDIERERILLEREGVEWPVEVP